MNKSKKIMLLLLFTFIVCVALAGCTLQDRIEEYSSDKEQCYLNTENVTRFSYIDILAESVTFDTATKIPLSKEDLSKIDWYGENAGQGRESWFYTDVYEIYGTDKAEAVAVNVNDNYYIAKRQ